MNVLLAGKTSVVIIFRMIGRRCSSTISIVSNCLLSLITFGSDVRKSAPVAMVKTYAGIETHFHLIKHLSSIGRKCIVRERLWTTTNGFPVICGIKWWVIDVATVFHTESFHSRISNIQPITTTQARRSSNPCRRVASCTRVAAHINKLVIIISRSFTIEHKSIRTKRIYTSRSIRIVFVRHILR